MLEKRIIKILDLKLYSGAVEFHVRNLSLRDKIMLGTDKSDAVRDYGTSHETLLLNLPGFTSFILNAVKNFIVMINEEPYLFAQDYFQNSEVLLLECLKSLYHYGIGLLPVMSEIYRHFTENNIEFGALEYKHLDIGINILPVMDEILNLLYKMNSSFVFEKPSDAVYSLCYFTIRSLVPSSVENPSFVGSQKATKDIYIERAILDSLIYKEEYKNLLYAWLNTKLEYKFRIRGQGLSAEASIHLLLKEYAGGLSIETIKFLCVNPVVDLDEVRQRASYYHSLNKKKD